jgi:site-specific recombinase XerD
VYGKGGKKVVLLSPETWTELISLKGEDVAADDPVFASRKGKGHLHPSQVKRIVTAAAVPGVDGRVSPHWLRHAHASHALDRRAPIHLVQATLGHASVATNRKYLHARPEDS